MELINLPDDILYQVLNKLDLSSIARICSTHSKFNRLCNKEYFWIYRYKEEFGLSLPHENLLSARDRYLKEKAQQTKTELFERISAIFPDKSKPIQPILQYLDANLAVYLAFPDFDDLQGEIRYYLNIQDDNEIANLCVKIGEQLTTFGKLLELYTHFVKTDYEYVE